MSASVERDPAMAGPAPDLPPAARPLEPLGPRQYAFWVMQELAPRSSVSNLALAFRTSQRLRWWPLHAAVNHLIARHPPLRTRFPAAEGVPLRHISAPGDVQLTVQDVAVQEADLLARVQEAAAAPFDLGADLPVRLVHLQVADGGRPAGSVVLLIVHHVVSDASSLSLLVDELARVYDSVAAGAGVPADLAGEAPWSSEPATTAEDARFWADHLQGLRPAESALPWARPVPDGSTFAGATVSRPMAAPAAAAVEQLRQSCGATENLVLLSAFYLDLFRHGAGPDLVVGVPVTTRREAQPAGVGFHVSTLPLRLVLDGRAGFRDLVRQVRAVFFSGAQHAAMSVEEVLAAGGHRSSDWRAPIFRHLFNYRPWAETEVTLGGEPVSFLTLTRTDSRLDLGLAVLGGRRLPMLLANYSTEAHDERDVAALLARLEALLCAAADEPDRPVAELDMVTEAERGLIARANDTRGPAGPAASVLERFRAVAAADPGRTAVVAGRAGGARTSYGDLAAAADRLSARLRAAGVVEGDVVALALPRGAAMAVAVLALWGVGAAYLPLSAGQPPKRVAAQITDARVRLLLTGPAGAPGGSPELWGAEAVAVPVLTVADPEAEPVASRETAERVEQPVAPGSPAYVIYTSGSTGTPRGVVVTHANLANVVADFGRRLQLGADDAVLWSTTPTFDISALEWMLPLTLGARVVVAAPDAQTRPGDLLDLVAEHDVTVVQGTPTFWRAALAGPVGDRLRDRVVLCGGEPLSARLARDLQRTGCRLFNVYGPSETTIWSTVAELTGDVGDPVPIGVPVANTWVFVADARGAQLPPGLWGELCIGGDGVSAGYLGRPDLTAERFGVTAAGARFYRTGDVARWTAQGTLELLGRTDRQVKLRGQRIELPEIENTLLARDEVAAAAVVLVGDPQSDGELRAFVQPAAGGIEDPALPGRLWEHLREHLPPAALPSRVVLLPALPQTPNGKVDHPALRSAAVDAAGAPAAGAVPDADPELTERLLTLWRNTLGRPALAESDHFFLNGGHSLLAAQLAERIAQVLDRDVPMRLVFDHPTARQLSAALAQRVAP